jgi:hypothetical protein
VLAPRREPEKIGGLYSLTGMPVWHNGQPDNFTYLGGLRVAADHRGRLAGFRDGFASVPFFVRALNLPERYFTSLAKDNGPARRLLEAGLKHLPRYRPQGEMITLGFSSALGKDGSLLRPASPADIPALLDLFNRQAARWDLSPRLDEAGLAGLMAEKSKTRIFLFPRDEKQAPQAGLGLLDLRSDRLITVMGYKGLLRPTRRFYNLWARATRRPPLPAPGANLPAVFLPFTVFAAAALPQAAACLKEVLFHIQAPEQVIAFLGLSPANPLWPVLRRCPHIAYTTVVERVYWEEEDSPLSFAPQPEIAFL